MPVVYVLFRRGLGRLTVFAALRNAQLRSTGLFSQVLLTDPVFLRFPIPTFSYALHFALRIITHTAPLVATINSIGQTSQRL